MKKLSVLLVALAVAVSASAGVNLKTNKHVKGNKIMPKTEMVKQTVKVNDLKANTKMRATIADPEGEAKTYARAGGSVYVSGGYITYGDQSKRIDMVYGENGKVYMKNLLFGSGDRFGDNWVEGQLNEDGTIITVEMGQSIYWSDEYQADVVLCWGSTVVEGTSLYMVPDDRVTEVEFAVDGETITMLGEMAAPDPDSGHEYYQYEATGLTCIWTDDDSWGGHLDYNSVFTETESPVTPTVITEIPESCEIYTFYRNSACIYNSFFGIGETVTDGKLVVAFDTNGDVYMQNPSWWHDSYGSWVKGTYDEATGTIIIPAGQYLTWSEDYEYGIQLGWGATYVYQDGVDDEGEPAYYMGYEIDERTTEFQFMLDGDNLYLLGCEGNMNDEFPLNYNATGLITYYSDDLSMTALEFTNRDEDGNEMPFGQIVNLVPAVPANPTADEWYDCGDETGYSRFYFTLPTTDVDGNMLDPEYLSYSIFVDNGNGPEIFHFTGDDYTFDLDYDADLTEIPYSLYSNAVDFHNYFIYMYRTNEPGYEPLFTDNIGIQAFYTVNGEKNASEIAWLYEVPDPTNTGFWLVMVHEDGTEEYIQLNQGANGDYTTVYDVTWPTYVGVGNFYFKIDGVTYGADENGTAAELGNAMMNPLNEGTNTYQVGVGYSYVLGVHLVVDETTGEIAGFTAYAAKGGAVNVDEISAKTVANVRYFNVAGQEVAQPEGVTLQVTTYTDGTKTTAKVVK